MKTKTSKCKISYVAEKQPDGSYMVLKIKTYTTIFAIAKDETNANNLIKIISE